MRSARQTLMLRTLGVLRASGVEVETTPTRDGRCVAFANSTRVRQTEVATAFMMLCLYHTSACRCALVTSPLFSSRAWHTVDIFHVCSNQDVTQKGCRTGAGRQ